MRERHAPATLLDAHPFLELSLGQLRAQELYTDTQLYLIQVCGDASWAGFLSNTLASIGSLQGSRPQQEYGRNRGRAEGG